MWTAVNWHESISDFLVLLEIKVARLVWVDHEMSLELYITIYRDSLR